MSETLQQLERLSATEARVAMATLVATRGTSPRREGAKMWVGEGGRILGSVTIGGCVDARVIQEADAVLKSRRPALLAMELGDEDARELGLTCAGAVDVLVEPVALEDPGDAAVTAYARIRRHTAAGGRAVLATPLGDPARKLVVLDTRETVGDLGDPGLTAAAAARAAQVLRRGVSRTLELGDDAAAVFFEVHGPPADLVVFGAGHIAQPLVRFARALGMRTTVVDARERYANRDAFPEADDIRVGIQSDIADQLRLDDATSVVLVAHDYKFDLPVLRRVLQSEAAYIGMLGSRRRGQTILRMLAEEGIAEEVLQRVHVPVGLDIGAETAAELAVSIVAEMLAVRTGRPGTPMRQRGR